jgi:hypothetical protein
MSQAGWFISIIIALGRQRQKNHELEASLDYIARAYFKKTKKEITI